MVNFTEKNGYNDESLLYLCSRSAENFQDMNDATKLTRYLVQDYLDAKGGTNVLNERRLDIQPNELQQLKSSLDIETKGMFQGKKHPSFIMYYFCMFFTRVTTFGGRKRERKEKKNHQKCSHHQFILSLSFFEKRKRRSFQQQIIT